MGQHTHHSHRSIINNYNVGSGMNLLDTKEKKWSTKAMEVRVCTIIIFWIIVGPPQVCAPGFHLDCKLGDPVTSSSVLGSISNYYVKKFGFSADCRLITFTGDNPCMMSL